MYMTEAPRVCTLVPSLIMCLLAFFVTSADKSQLFIYNIMLFTNILPEAVCCSETLNVYVVLFCILM